MLKVIKSPQFATAMAAAGCEPLGSTPAEMAALIAGEGPPSSPRSSRKATSSSSDAAPTLPTRVHLHVMHLVQILLPLNDRARTALPSALFGEMRRELVDRFGGPTAYTRAPAKGLWNEGSLVDRDDIVVYEVMVSGLDRLWWSQYRTALAQRFDQEEIVVRALATEKL